MPTLIVSIFNGVQANWVHVTQLVGLLTLLAGLLHWGATVAASKDKPTLAHVILMIAASCDAVLRFLAYAVALLFSLFGKTPPPMTKRFMRGPFDDYSDRGIDVLGKKPPSSPYRVNMYKPAPVSRVPIFGRSMMAMAVAAMIAITVSPLAACQALKPAEIPTAQEVACVAGRLAQNPNETPGQLLTDCTLAGLDLLQAILEIVVGQFTTPSVTPADGGPVLVGVSNGDVASIVAVRARTMQNVIAASRGSK